MTNAVTFCATWADNRPISELRQLIEARQKLIGETAKDAVTSTAINILRSIRAQTVTAKKANPYIIGDRWIVTIEESPYVTGWARPGHDPFLARRVIRTGPKGRAIDRVGPARRRIINLAGPYKPGEGSALKVYHFVLRNAYAVRLGPCQNLYVVAKSREDVEAWAENRIRRRIGQYSGVSKRALSIAMHKFSVEAGGDRVSPGMDRLVSTLVSVRAYGHGFNGGEFGVTVEDNLPRAMLSLKNGAASLNLAMRAAANRTAGIINHSMSRGFGEKIPTPFPEIKSKRRIA